MGITGMIFMTVMTLIKAISILGAMAFRDTSMTIDHVIQQLKGYEGGQMVDPRFKPSAVLILLLPTPSGYSILITARSRKLHNHRPLV